MRIGYARVSAEDQNLDRRLDALQAVGCERIYQEKVTGKAKHRPELDRMLGCGVSRIAEMFFTSESTVKARTKCFTPACRA